MVDNILTGYTSASVHKLRYSVNTMGLILSCLISEGEEVANDNEGLLFGHVKTRHVSQLLDTNELNEYDEIAIGLHPVCLSVCLSFIHSTLLF